MKFGYLKISAKGDNEAIVKPQLIGGNPKIGKQTVMRLKLYNA